MESLFLLLATLCYGIGTVGYLIYLMRDWFPIHRASWGVLLIGAVFHLCAIVIRAQETHHLPVTNSQEAASFFAFMLIVSYLLAQIRLQVRILGSFVSPLAVIFMLTSTLLPAGILPQDNILRSGWVIFHVTALFLANSLFALAASAGVMYLVQERNIKRKNFGFLYPRFPSLERLDQINYYCIVVGFPLMTLGLIAGFAYASTVWRSSWGWDPKEIFSLITWFIYAISIHERLTVGWRGRRAAWLAIFGFSAVLTTFLGVNLLFKGSHTFFVR
ncbi:MAG: c-type cytochrome biogenesis protein CcsB [Acidobacteriota bacterium]